MILKKSFFLKLVDNWPVKILSIAAAVVLMQLYRINTLEERFFTIPLEIQINDRFISIDSSVEKVRIKLTGNEEDIFSVLEEDIEAYIDLSSKTVEGEFQAPVLIKKKGSALNVKNLAITVDPIYARTHLEQVLTRPIVVQPKLNGFPLSGYKLERYFIAPSQVTVTGPKSQIEDLQFIQTEDIDLLGRFEDFTVLSRLVHQSDYITFLGGDVIEFTGIITEELLIRTFDNLNIVSVDLADNLLINGILSKATIKVQGTQQRLEKIKLQNLQFTVDCSGIRGPGLYTFPVTVDIPDDLAVLTYNPSKVEFEVVSIEETVP
ncbi:MAG: CdaR family protein [Spirochaetaceae bacterium]|nr:CdaR family protein [Spirochaetaceae bacterium]